MNAVIIKTPFHLRQFLRVAEDNTNKDFYGREYVFFISQYVNKEYLIEKFPSSKIVEIRDYKFRQIDFLKNPLVKLLEYRRFIYSLKIKISRYVAPYKNMSIRLIIFSEKDVFTQIFIFQLKQVADSIKITAIDEGASYYNKNKPIDYFLKIIYPPISKIFFNFPYKYYRVFGTSSVIDDVYVRWEHLLNYRNPNKIYYKMKVENNGCAKQINGTRKVLIITSCLSEGRLMSKKSEIEMYNILFRSLNEAGFNIYVKIHPLESESKFLKYVNSDKINIIENIDIAEDIDFFEYAYIINFGSAVVLDMIEKNYPADRIITIDKIGISKNCSIYRMTKLATLKNISEYLKI
ncbi:hypothetical protein KA977_06945 [Candidatus Dependentiae bacterium]|nr:hypothetical protein [Candidatus Dependentiae bacterium]